jgi:Fe-S-cluster containining protein
VEDRFLIDEGIIPVKHLFTIREGEPVRDNVQNRFGVAHTDIIKIKNTVNSPFCLFFHPGNSHCAIYENRPMECRLLKCWDTGDIESYYDKARLTRKELVGNIKGLWEIVEDHQKQCGFSPVYTFAEAYKAGGRVDPDLEKQVIHIIKYDFSVRALVCEKGNMAPEILEFLLGRPMPQILAAMGIKTFQNKHRLFSST